MSNHANRFEKIYAEWRKFVRGGPVDHGIVRPVILEAWQRCKVNNVDPYLTRVPVVLEGKELEGLLARNSGLIDISRPFMEHLYGFVKGSNFIVASRMRRDSLSSSSEMMIFWKA